MDNGRLVITPTTDSDKREVEDWFRRLTGDPPNARISCELVEYRNAIVIQGSFPAKSAHVESDHDGNGVHRGGPSPAGGVSGSR
jgi:hypothetical protein